MTQVARNPKHHRHLARPEKTEISTAFAKPYSRRRKASFLSFAVVSVFVPGLVSTVALPAYAYRPTGPTEEQLASAALWNLKQTGKQSFQVPATASAPAVSRDAFSATTHEELAARKAAEEAAAAAALAAEAEAMRIKMGLPAPSEATAATAFTGPSPSEYLASVGFPAFSLDAVAQLALQYQGVPYVFGGADPSGFDCSGFVMFVYAQFGIYLPHSVSGQAALGTPISRDAAVPGDVVTMDGHNGIYLGNGTFIDAPREGKTLQVRAIWSDDYYIYRLGI